jgi:hypothetical protein
LALANATRTPVSAMPFTGVKTPRALRGRALL